jgi:integrase
MVFRLYGRQRRIKLGNYSPDPKKGMTLAQAREEWRAARIEIKAGRDPNPDKPQEQEPDCFKSVFEEWMKRDQEGNRSAREVRRTMDRDVLPRWGLRPIASITKRDVIELLDFIVDSGRPVHANRVLSYVHRMFRWALGREIVLINPATAVERPTAECERERVLSDEELARVWRGAEQLGYPFGPAIQLLITTGLRGVAR